MLNDKRNVTRLLSSRIAKKNSYFIRLNNLIIILLKSKTELHLLTMRLQQLTATLILALLFSFSLPAMPMRHLDMKDGLSSYRAFQLEKDTMGFIWIVTPKGVDRFDGNQIRNYKLFIDHKEEGCMPSTKMVRDRNGYIWVAFQSGVIFRYDKTVDDFIQTIDMHKEIQADGIQLHSIFFDTSNRLWICTNRGLYIRDTQETIHYISEYGEEYPFSICEVNPELFYIGCRQGVFLAKYTHDNHFSIIESNSSTRHCGKVEVLLLQQHKLYIGTATKGLFIYNMENKECTSFYPAICDKPIRVIRASQKAHILVGTDGAGIYCIDNQTNQIIKTYTADINNEHADLKSNAVYTILVDEFNRIWAGTFTNGVNIIEYSTPSTTRWLKHQYRNENSLANNCINAVFEDSSGKWWLGHNNGISVYNPITKQWQHYLDNEKDKIVIISLAEDSHKRIWAGSYGKGAFCIDPKSGKITSYGKKTEDSNIGLYTDYVYGLYANGDDMWLGGLEGGLTQYNLKNDTYKYHNIDAVSVMQPINDSILICGSAYGFSLLNKRTGIFKRFSSIEGTPLIGKAVRSIYVENKNSVWMATEGEGIICFHPSSEKVELFTTKQGLPSDYLVRIENDDEGRLWCTTETEVFYMDMQTKNIVSMNDYLGIEQVGYTGGGTKTKDGHIIFGTVDGAFYFKPFERPNIQSYSKTIFTDFRLFYNTVKAGAKGSVLKTSINETKSIVMDYDQNTFAFAFSSINFKYPNQVEYSYKLEGFDKDWNIAEGNMVNYNNMSPGHYIFKLKSQDKDTHSVIDERSIKIDIKPPFWESGWAIALYTLLILLIAYFIIQYGRNKIAKHNSIEKIQFFINVAHDIRTPITLIKGPLSELEENEHFSEHGRQALELANKNIDRLYQMISKLLDFQKADLSALRLIVSKNELNEYIDERVSQFRIEAYHKQIRITIEAEIEEPLYVWFDREKMDRILNNLLSNAIKYTPDKGTIQIAVGQNDKKWFITVKDSGIGIPQSEQKYLFKRFFRAKNAINSKETGSGIGLLLVQKLVALHKGTISFTSKEGAGTEFRVTFHKGNQYFSRNQVLDSYLSHNAPKVQVMEEKDINTPPLEAEDAPSVAEEKSCILLVEDNNEMRTFLRNSLNKEYRIVEATDGDEVEANLQEWAPDLIVSDVMMQRMNGDELSRKLKSSIETSHIPIILLTALSDKENIIKGLDEGADDYITKPFDLYVLKARIRNLLRNRKKLQIAVTSCTPTEEKVVYDNSLDKEFMERIDTLIEEHMDNSEYSVDGLCRDMAMSRSSLYNKIKALTGQGPNDYSRFVRLKRAAELLVNQQYNVSEVATLTGFGDSKYFSTAFKKQFGQSPSKYGK